MITSSSIRNILLAVAIVSYLILVNELVGQQSSGKSAYRANPQLTGEYVAKGVKKLNGLKWKKDLGREITSSPYIEGRYIFVNTWSKEVNYCYRGIDLESGQIGKDDKHLSICGVNGTPIVIDGFIYAEGSYSLIKYSLAEMRRAFSKKTWQFKPKKTKGITTPTVSDGIIYIGSQRSLLKPFLGKAYAIDADTGKEIWSADYGAIRCTIALNNGVVYFASLSKEARGSIFALNSKTGEKYWNSKVDAVIFKSIAFRDGMVYVQATGENSSKTYALNADSGNIKWKREVGGECNFDNNELAISSDFIYFAQKNVMYALNKENGEEVWKQRYKYDVSSPSIADGVLYFSAAEGSLLALDAGTGHEMWRFRTEDLDKLLKKYKKFSVHAPTIHNDVVYYSVKKYLFAVY